MMDRSTQAKQTHRHRATVWRVLLTVTTEEVSRRTWWLEHKKRTASVVQRVSQGRLLTFRVRGQFLRTVAPRMPPPLWLAALKEWQPAQVLATRTR